LRGDGRARGAGGARPRAVSDALPIEVAAALWKLGLPPSADLPAIAYRALEEGRESPALCALVLEADLTRATVGPRFERALEDLAIALPAEESAARAVAMHYARDIARCAIPPYGGARRIWWDVCNRFEDAESPIWRDFSVFVGLASEYEDFAPSAPCDPASAAM